MAPDADAGTSGTTDERVIEARMPSSIKTDDFTTSLGRTFQCPECGQPSSGTCEHCGHTHSKLRDDPGGGR